jgi:hypothetical protein
MIWIAESPRVQAGGDSFFQGAQQTDIRLDDKIAIGRDPYQ